MQDKLNQKLIQILRIAELIIAVLLLAAILIGIAGLILKTGFFEIETIKNIDFSIFLSSSFSLVIGIEFTRMLINHSADAVAEVLLFAIARQLVIGHNTAWEKLIGVIAIACVFAIRKYLYPNNSPEFDFFIFNESKPIMQVNRITQMSLPAKGGETIGEFLEKQLAKLSQPLEEGASVVVKSAHLRVATMKNGFIETVCIIHKLDEKNYFS